MTSAQIRALLAAVSSGEVAPDDAHRTLVNYLRELPIENLGFARIDHHRTLRQGFPEVVLALGKTPDQVSAIAKQIVGRGHSLLITRADPPVHAAVSREIAEVTYRSDARTITLAQGDITPGHGTILIVTAGTSDVPVAEEAAVTAELMGNRIERLYDVGVAGIHRLLSEHVRLTSARVIIVVAGMEGALPSVVSGLVQVPVVAVPTSVGYGASFGGIAALLGMLNSCASGVSVVNIDNGFGAAFTASLINHLEEPAMEGPRGQRKP